MIVQRDKYGIPVPTHDLYQPELQRFLVPWYRRVDWWALCGLLTLCLSAFSVGYFLAALWKMVMR